MPEIILRGAVVHDDWQVLRPSGGQQAVVPAGRVIVPLPVWQADHEALSLRGGVGVGVWLAGTDEPGALAPWLGALKLVAVDFPKFTDGRGYSIAHLLRSRHAYRGELRAIGDVLPDQLFYMSRVGFDAFAVRADKDIRQALRSLQPFSDSYQGSWSNPVPAYRRHERGWPRGAGA
ncbi:MAG TPA: DUF934 domain-containing protein [Burkholderiales bacterium]|nr:DUF934 domain-containing protein [Burkholderiales bacterium]